MADNSSFQFNLPNSTNNMSTSELGSISLLESGSPYSQKLMEAGLSFHDKMLLARQANLYKLANIEGYRRGYIVGSDDPEESTDLDSGLLQDEASGDLYRFRMRHAGNFDTVDTADVVAKSRNKMSYQPEYVAALSGKRVEDLTEFDFKNVKNYQTRQTLDKWQDPDYPDLPYNPNFTYEAPRINNKIPVLYKSTGTGFYGRDLTDMINPATGRSMTFDAASNPYLNSSFKLSDYLNTERNQQRINEFNALPSQPLKDKATQKRINNLFEQPTNNRFSRTFNSKNISMDDIIDKYQADRNDFMEFVDQLGYNVDKAQASLKQTIGHLARALLPSSWIDENYWKSLDKPVNEQGMTLADVLSGVDPIQYAIHQRHNKENDAVWDKAKGEYEKGNYGMAAVNALNYLRKSIVDVNYLLADSFGQMAASSGGTAVGGTVGGIIGGMVGGPTGAKVGAHIGAFLTGTMITAFDETVMARDQYKEQNNGQDMSPERILATFGAHMVAAAPEQVLQMIGLKKVLPNKISNAIFRGEEKIATRASADIPKLLSAKGAVEIGKQVGKAFLGAGTAEAGQEGFQNFVTAYASQNQQNPKSAWEVATDDEQLKAALAGFAMGGVMHGTATGIGLRKSLNAEKAEAVRQETLAQTRQTQTSAGTSANTDASTEAINLANSTAINASTSAADSIKAAQELRNKRSSIYLNINADEALMKKEAEANLDAAKKLHADGASSDEITKQTGLTPQQILSVYAYMSNYNADYAKKHNTRVNEHTLAQMQDELYQIADDIGLTREEAKKTLEQVAADIRFGPDGYENYGRKIRMGHEELLRTDLSEDQKKAIKRTTDLYTLKMVNLMANEVAKLNQFAKGLEDIVFGQNNEIPIKYPSGGGFTLKGKYLARYDPALKKGAIGVIDDIYDSIKEMESFLTNGQNIPEAAMKAVVNRFNGSNKNMPLNFDDIEPIKKRVDNALTKIRELGQQEFAPVEAVTDKTIKDYVDRIGKAVKAVQKNKTESIDYTKKVRALTHILYQQNDAYDQLVKGINNSSKLTEEQKAEYIDYLKGLKQATDEHKQKAADIKAEYPGTKKNAQDLIARYNDNELDKYILKAEDATDLDAYTNATKPLTEIRDSIGKAINAFKAVSTSSKEDAELIENLANLYNNVAKRIGNNRTTFNNKNKTSTVTSATQTTDTNTQPTYSNTSPNAFPVLTDKDFNDIFKNTTSKAIKNHIYNLRNMINKKEREVVLSKTDKDPSTISFIRSLKARLELAEKWEATVNSYTASKKELKSTIDVNKYGGYTRKTNKILTAVSDGQLDKIAKELKESIAKSEKALKISNQKGEKNEGAEANIKKGKNGLKLIEARRAELRSNPRLYRKNRSGIYIPIPFQLTDEDKAELKKLGDELTAPYRFTGVQNIIKDLFRDIEVDKGITLDVEKLAYGLSSNYVEDVKNKKLTPEQLKDLKETFIAAVKAIGSAKGELAARLKDVEEMYGKQIDKKHIISGHLMPLLQEALTLAEGNVPTSTSTARTSSSTNSQTTSKPTSTDIVPANEQEWIKNDPIQNLWPDYYNTSARIRSLNKIKNKSKEQEDNLAYHTAKLNLIKQQINKLIKDLDQQTDTGFSKLSDEELKNLERLTITTLNNLRLKANKDKLIINDKIDEFHQLVSNEIDLPLIRRELAIRKARAEGKPIVKPIAKPNESKPTQTSSQSVVDFSEKYRKGLESAGLTKEQAQAVTAILIANAKVMSKLFGMTPEQYLNSRFAGYQKMSQKEFEEKFSDALYQDAYNGGPYKFDKFSTEFINSGEGTQAHGWGMYFTSDKEMADAYRELTANGKNLQRFITLKGEHPRNLFVQAVLRYIDLPKKFESVSEFRKVFREQLEKRFNSIRRDYRDIINHPDLYEGEKAYTDRIANEYWRTKHLYEMTRDEDWNIDLEGYNKGPKYTGQVYKVDIPENDELLDKNLPLASQPEIVEDAINKLFTEKECDEFYENEKLIGLDIYKKLSEKLSSDKAASLALAEHNVKGLKYNTGAEDNFVIFDADLINIVQTYYQKKEGQDAKGAITFSGGMSLISIFEKGDVSTAIHETGHFFCDEFRNAYKTANVPQWVKDAWASMEKAYKFKGTLDGLDEKSRKKWIEVQERFGRDFEAYMREGKAPTKELEGVFALCKRWLKEIYRNIKSLLGSRKLSPEMRKVFDALFTEHQETQTSTNSSLAIDGRTDTLDITYIQATKATKGKIAGTFIDKNGNYTITVYTKNKPNSTNTKYILSTINSFIKYIKGEFASETSIQKKEVFNKLAEKGYNETFFKNLLKADKGYSVESNIHNFILFHEKSHIRHDDPKCYWDQGANLLTDDKIAIEVRATEEAIQEFSKYKEAGKSSQPQIQPAQPNAQISPEDASGSTERGGDGNSSTTPSGSDSTASQAPKSGSPAELSKGYVLHSGGAKGSDSAWSDIAKEKGLKITSNHYYYGDKTPKGNIELTEEQFNEGLQHVSEAEKTLDRHPKSEKVKNLLARNWFQVKNADAVYAIAEKFETTAAGTTVVAGGTGWAVQMAIDNHKPVYVFNTEKNQWYYYNYKDKKFNGYLTLDKGPVLTKNFAGIGSRFKKLNYVLPKNARQAIEDVYEATFGDTSNMPSGASQSGQNGQGVQTPTETAEASQNGSQSEIPASQEEAVPWSDTLPAGVQEAPQTIPAAPVQTSSQPIPMPKREDYATDQEFASAILKWTQAEADRKNTEDQAARNEIAGMQGDYANESVADASSFNPTLADAQTMEGPYNPEGDTSEKGKIVNAAKEAVITVDAKSIDPTKINKKQVKLHDKLVDIFFVDKKSIKNGIYGYDEAWNLYLSSDLLNPANIKATLKISDDLSKSLASILQNKSYNDIIDNMSNLELIRAIVRYAERKSQHDEHAKERNIVPNAFDLDIALYTIYKAAIISKDSKVSTYRQPDLNSIYLAVQNKTSEEYKIAEEKGLTKTVSPNYFYTLGDFVTNEMIANAYKDTEVQKYATYQLHNVNRASATIINTPNDYVSAARIPDESVTKNSKGEEISYLRKQIRVDKSDSYVAINPKLYANHLSRRRKIYEGMGLVREKGTMFTSPQPSKDIEGNYTGTYRSRLDNSPHIRLLYDIEKDGDYFNFTLNETTLSVADFSFLEFVSGAQFSRYMNPNDLSDTEVCHMFGLAPETASIAEKIEAREVLRTQGVPKNAMANAVGRLMMDNLGLRPNYDQGYAETWERMATGLGAFIIDFGERYGLYEFNQFTPEEDEYEWLSGKTLNLIKSTENTIPTANLLKEEFLGTATVGKGAHLNNGANRFKVEDSESNDVPIFNTPPRLDPDRIAYVHNTKQDLPLSKKQIKVIDKAQHQAYQFDLDIVDYMLQHEAEIAARLGYIPTDNNPVYNDMGFETKESTLGVNNGIARQFEALKMYAPKQRDMESIGEFKGIFFRCFITKNARFSINSNMLNPQNQKIHRFCCIPVNAWKNYEVNFEKESPEWYAENFAIAQAFDALGDREKYTAFAEDMKKLNKDQLIKMRDYLVSLSDSQFALTCLREFKIKDIGIESIPQCLNALQHLIRRQEAKAKGATSYRSSLFCEDDSTTSGYAINFLNMPLESLTTNPNFLHKVGVFMFVNDELQTGNIQLSEEQKKSLDFTMDELKKIPGFLDIYKTFGVGASERIIDLEDNDGEKLLEIFKAKVAKNIKFKAEAKVRKANEGKDLSDEQIETLINEEIKTASEKEGKFMFDLFEKLRPALPSVDKNKNISSSFRELVKYPIMYFGYSAGAKKIATEISYKLMDEIINTYLAVYRQNGSTVKDKVENYLVNHLGYRANDVLEATTKSKDDLEAMAAKSELEKKEEARKKALAVYDAITFIDEHNKEYRKKNGKIGKSVPLATRLKTSLTSKIFVGRDANPDAYRTTFMHMFDMLIGTTYGDSIGKVLEDQFRHLVCKNNMMIWMSSTMARLYIDRRNKAIDDVRFKDYRGEITYAQIKQIEEDLFKAGVTPYTTLASNTPENDARILLYKSKRITDPINEVQDYTAQQDENGEIKNTLTSTVYADVREPTTPGRSGAVLPTHGMDGDSIMDTFLEFVDRPNNPIGMNIIHDAVGMSPLDQLEVVPYYSKNLMTTAQHHSIFGTMFSHFVRCVEAAKAIAEDPTTIDDIQILNDSGDLIYASEFDKHLITLPDGINEEYLKFAPAVTNANGEIEEEDKVPITIGMLLEKGKIWNELIDERRDWLFSHKLFCVNMGGCKGCTATYDFKAEGNGQAELKYETEKQINENSEGSHSDGFKTDGEINVTKTQAIDNAEARVDFLDDLHSMSIASGNTTCSEGHMDNLRSFIKLVKPEAFKDIIVELVDNGLFNAGMFTHNPTGTSTIQITLDARYNIDPFTKVAVESCLLSPEETYGHEIVHAAMFPAFENAGVFGYHREIAMLQRIYQEAAKAITWEDLMPEEGTYDSSLKSQYEQYMKATHEYIFNNPDYKHNRGLKEFCAYAISSEKFQKILKDKLSNKYNDKTKATKFIDKLINLVRNIFKVFFSKAKFRDVFSHTYNIAKGLDSIKKKDMYNQLITLINKMALADTKASNKLMQHSKKTLEHMFSLLGNLVNRYNRPLGQWLKKHTIELADTKEWFDLPERLIKIDGSFLDKAKLYSACLALYPISKRHRKAWRSLLTNLLNVSQQGVILSTLRDITKPDYDSSSLELLSVKNRELDGLYKSIEFNVREELKEHFGRDLTEPEEVALTTVLLRTDIQSLYNGKNISYLAKLISDPNFLYDEIDRLDAEISKLYTKRDDYNWVMGQCVGLARYMVTGKGNEQLNTTARGIATGYFYDKVLPYTKESEELISKIATLFALKHTPEDQKKVIATIPKEGFEHFIKMHKEFVNETTEGVKIDDENMSKRTKIIERIHIAKGYTKQLLDTTYETKINFTDAKTQREMSKLGYTLFFKINPDAVTKREEPIGIYKRFGIPKRRDGAAASLQGYDAIGTSLTDMSYWDMDKEEALENIANEERRRNIVEIYKKNADVISDRLRRRMKGAPMTFEDFDKFSSGFSPIASPTREFGDLSDYRVTMSYANKRIALGLNEKGIDILSKMYASINKKAQSSIANKALLEFLYDYMNKHMDSGTHRKINDVTQKFVEISDITDNAYLKEAWRVLPKEFKEAIKKKPLWVRDDWLQDLFGVSNMSLNDTKWVKKIPYKWVKRFISVAEYIMKTIAYYRKEAIILKIPAVLIGNLVSNFMYSVANHGDPFKIFKLTLANARAIRDYLDTKKELNRIILKQRIGTATNEELGRKNILKGKLQSNIVHPLMEKGMYQSIVEDMNPEELESTSKITKLLKYNKIAEKTPSLIKTALNHLYLGKGTPIHDFMFTATQYSDFIARATEYQLRMDKAKSEYERIKKEKPTVENAQFKLMNYDEFYKVYERITSIRVLNAFINYDKPQSQVEQYLNDVGLLFFSKFGKRIQHVITDQLWENPLGAIMFLISQRMFIDTEDIFEQNLFQKDWTALVSNPISNFLGIAMPMPLQFATGQQDPF